MQIQVSESLTRLQCPCHSLVKKDWVNSRSTAGLGGTDRVQNMPVLPEGLSVLSGRGRVAPSGTDTSLPPATVRRGVRKRRQH